MTVTTGTNLRLVAFFAFLALLHSANLFGQNYPSKAVRVVVPVAAGGGADFLMRLLADPLGDRLGQPVLVENRPGADGNIGFAAVASAPADGHSLIFMLPGVGLNPLLYENLPFKTADFAPISHLASYYFAFVANPSFPAKNLADLIRISKANPGTVKFGNAGGTVRLLMAVFQERTGSRWLDVPFKGAGDARPALLSGTIDFYLDTPAGPLPLIKSGRLNVIGVGGPNKMTIFPEAQPMGEVIPGFEAGSWLGLGGPAAMSRDRIDKVSKEVAFVLKSPDIRDRLDKVFYEPVGSTPEVLAARIRSDIEIFGKVIKDLNIKAN